MKIDPDALNGYLRDLAQQQEAFETAKRKIEYLKLQIKQVRAQTKIAKQDPLIKEFIKRMPKDQVSVTPSPGLTYVSVTLFALEASLYRSVPDDLGLKVFRDEEQDPNKLLGPRLKVYRSPHSPGVHFYVTQHIR
jgi:hypothetical protein